MAFDGDRPDIDARQILAKFLDSRPGEAGSATIEELEYVLDLAHSLDSPVNAARIMRLLGETLMAAGRNDEAEQYFLESSEVSGSVGDEDGCVRSLTLLAALAYEENQMRRAADLYRQAIRRLEAISDWEEVAGVVAALGEVQESRRWTCFSQALWLYVMLDVDSEIACLLVQRLFYHLGPRHAAAPLFAAAACRQAYQVAWKEDGAVFEDQAMALMRDCVDVRGIKPDDITQWFDERGLLDDAQVRRRLMALLEDTVGPHWLFDRHRVLEEVAHW